MRRLVQFVLLLALVAGLAAISRKSLDACGIQVFGYAIANCTPPPEPTRPAAGPSIPDELTGENDRLSGELRKLELRLASLRSCPVPPPPPPEPVVQPPPPPPPEKPPAQETLKAPEQLADIAGCWQSVRGDIPLASDDEERRPMGNIRECLCFGTNGRGRKRQVYTDGFVCDGIIQASLASGSLRIEQPEFNCGSHGGFVRGRVRSMVICKAGSGDGTACTTYGLGRRRSESTEDYVRVTPQHCQLGN